MSKVHNLKVMPKFFRSVCDGTRDFELRYNDRNFEKDDKIILHEYDNGKYTGASIERIIGFILDDFSGLEDGYVILGLKQA